jgi:hypothetical protein
LEIKDQEFATVGEIRYDYSSNRFCGISAITTLHLNACIYHCSVGNIFSILDMKDKIPPHYVFLPMATGRYKFPKNVKYSGGEDFNFYSVNDLDNRLDDFLCPIENDILPRMDNLLNNKMELFSDIISCQDYYKYPFATMLIALYLNDKANADTI